MEDRGFASDGDLEAVSGVSASLISRYQSGGITPTAQNLRKLAPHLGVTLGDLMVASGLATPEELGMVTDAPARTRLDAAVAEANRYLADPRLPDNAKDHLRATIRGAVTYWRQQLGVNTSIPAQATRRATSTGRKAR